MEEGVLFSLVFLSFSPVSREGGCFLGGGDMKPCYPLGTVLASSSLSEMLSGH